MSEFTSSIPLDAVPTTGFDFENEQRNRMLGGMQGSEKLPKPMKTGTTIVGMLYKDGVVLGADTRATSGTEVAEKNCRKIHYMAPNIYCCGAGTAADCDKVTDLISSQLELLRMNTHTESRIVTACTLLKRRLFRYQGNIGAHLILGGCDINGPQLYQIHAHGSTANLTFTTMGSGSLAAMSVMESGWQEGMAEADAVKLVQRAVGAGIFNDLGSGSNCDICVLRMDGSIDYRRNDVKPNEITPLRNSVAHSERLTMKVGLTPTLGQPVFKPHPRAPTLADVTVTEMEVES
eukprot:CAMPEP_0119573294 /NCGR_PEP_ID=MMETSP1352-20130426/45048_1 /TAXON_ID=265584 /ORGANISM="Stauroneis constricta, Strain CCMP1120" /LENGTH=290 /DNA_ID=CAMNT_0007622981 /DNA_START=198 /DNA_END=1070 /DNA_ORIENTATION=+